jgi:nicotinamide-nucleotide amidase
LLTQGMGESMIAERIVDWENRLDPSIKLAYLPNLGRVRLRLSSTHHDKQLVESKVQTAIDELLPLIEDIFVGFEDDRSIETIIGEMLVKKSQTLSLAESCTGGAIAERLTSFPGASRYFVGGLVSYATSIKEQVLGVEGQLIKDHGVVSEEVAIQMAYKAKNLFKSDYAISTTGNAGPTTSEGRVSVGTVCMALATPTGVDSYSFQFGNSRERVINKAINKAFELLYNELLKNASKEV